MIIILTVQGTGAIVYGALIRGRCGEMRSLTVPGYFTVFCAGCLAVLRESVLAA